MQIRKLVVLLIGLTINSIALAQDPVRWSFHSKKISGNQYRIELIAAIQPGWHLYSQKQPANAIALPTAIRFTKHPLLQLKGSILEKGDLKKIKEQILGTEAWQFAGQVSFTQLVEVKGKVKTNVLGFVQFQVCTDEKCLPPKTIDFSIALE